MTAMNPYDQPCGDPDCIAQACPEHQHHNCGDHTYEQHHNPEDHVSGSPCRCDVYLPSGITGWHKDWREIAVSLGLGPDGRAA